jgi:hypothetical protein
VAAEHLQFSQSANRIANCNSCTEGQYFEKLEMNCCQPSETPPILKHTLQQRPRLQIDTPRRLANPVESRAGNIHKRRAKSRQASFSSPAKLCVFRKKTAGPIDRAGSAYGYKVTENTLTNLDTNISINLSVCQPVVRIGENVGHPHVLSFVLAMFPEALPCDHDWHR